MVNGDAADLDPDLLRSRSFYMDFGFQPSMEILRRVFKAVTSDRDL
jgi:hypothetical protein